MLAAGEIGLSEEPKLSRRVAAVLAYLRNLDRGSEGR
jgi:hypothetical protein